MDTESVVAEYRIYPFCFTMIKMTTICPITGRVKCECGESLTSSGAMMKLNLRDVLRKLFTDHVIYTNWLIVVSLPKLQDSADAVTDRLLENPKDIARLLDPLIGHSASYKLERLITDHLVIAKNLLTLLREKKDTKQEYQCFSDNAEELGKTVSTLNPGKLREEDSIKMWKTHIDQVVQLAKEQNSGQHKRHTDTFDNYYKHMLVMSDMIYELFTK